jgi:hypothetical protein
MKKGKPWQVWVRMDGTLSYPRDATFEELCQLANELIECAARAKRVPQPKEQG